MRYAILSNDRGEVINIIEGSFTKKFLSSFNYVASETAKIGDIYVEAEGTFRTPNDVNEGTTNATNNTDI